MKLIGMYNYDEREEVIRVDQIESVRMPSGRVHDNGAVVLIGGRQIAFGTWSGAEMFIKQLRKITEGES